MTVGGSASLTNQRSLAATVRGGVHAPAANSENFSVAEASLRSSQLTMAPRLEAVAFACPDSPCAGTGMRCTDIASGDSLAGSENLDDWPHPAAARAASGASRASHGLEGNAI